MDYSNNELFIALALYLVIPVAALLITAIDIHIARKRMTQYMAWRQTTERTPFTPH